MLKKQNVYEEHEKMKLIKNESQILGEFLSWLKDEREPNIILCEYDTYDQCSECRKNIEQILAEYFKIDLNKIEKEKQQMIEGLRCVNGASPKK